MRISISGTSGSGKSTLVTSFLQRWPMYQTPKSTYRDFLKENNLLHSSETDDETQGQILAWMLTEQDKHPKGSKVIYDRCPWDCLAYTMQANADGKVSDGTTAVIIDLVKRSLKELDIIFWVKHEPSIKIVDDGLRDIDPEFIKATDRVFADLYHQYADHLEDSPFYITEDCPAIIPIEGLSVDDRISWIGEFINRNGELIETESSILDPENSDILEQLLKDQEGLIDSEGEFKKMVDNVKNIEI